MVRKRIKLISEESNHYDKLQEAMDDFIRFKIAHGMSELTMRDYKNTFERFMKVSSNDVDMDTIKKELLQFLTPLSDASPAKFNRPYSNLYSLFNWLVKQNTIEYNPLFDTSTSQGMMFLQMIGTFAEFERKTINERTKGGRISASDGVYAGGSPAYGYMAVDGELVKTYIRPALSRMFSSCTLREYLWEKLQRSLTGQRFRQKQARGNGRSSI